MNEPIKINFQLKHNIIYKQTVKENLSQDN